MSSDGNLTQDEIDALLGGADQIDTIEMQAPEPSSESSAIRESEISRAVSVINAWLDYITGTYTDEGVSMTFSNVRATMRNNNEIVQQLSNMRLIQARCDYTNGVVGEN